MNLINSLQSQNVSVQQLNDASLAEKKIFVDVLRLDKIHNIISGNKWFKLKYYLEQALESNYTSVATFGGAYSNHILATAYACNQLNLGCTGFIRGEEPKVYSPTLNDAKASGMKLKFISRGQYENKQDIINANKSTFFIPEGGYGKTGAKGAAEIIQFVPNFANYNHIVCAVGTGTMLAGIVNASHRGQHCIGISVMKNNVTVENEMRLLIKDEAQKHVMLLHNYDFGGYAKYTQPLIDFINKIWTTNHLPLDFVYTAKALYAVFDLAVTSYFNPSAKILFVHSGGLQGNRSLMKEILMFG